jgi:hypothetical protein
MPVDRRILLRVIQPSDEASPTSSRHSWLAEDRESVAERYRVTTKRTATRVRVEPERAVRRAT